MAIMPPAPGAPMPGPAMGAPGMAPMSGPAGDTAPATQMLAPLAMLAQQQQQALAVHSQQMTMMRDAMKEQILRLVSMMPMANPAGMAARTEPLPPSMSAEDSMNPEAQAGAESSAMEDY